MSAFGVPITDETLKAMSRYKGKTITQEDRAREAVRLIHSEDKNLNALNHALTLKFNYGDGVSTLCLLYNATGDTLEIVDGQKQDWHGSVEKEEPPRSFDNGQWVAFLHTHPTSEAYGCEAARVYRGKNIKGDVRDFMVAWSTPWGSIQNAAYTEVRERDHFPPHWDYIKVQKLEKAGKITKDETDEYCASTVSIGGITSPEFIAILQHKFSPLP
ncbi:23 kDa jasmonate-induced protein-like [Vicia villosa]|uniref:23 kDa jasmonate-induced protein-like n=1 Tax=Vicia villosa TaxID=3911 RepID=UPI00273BEB62|nr:23 kDa jasmonate-induced protein-like [Vicia villosa]